MKQQSNIAHLPTLDGWRAVAIALVIFAHGFPSIEGVFDLGLGEHADGIKSLGLLGVQIFFGLSGLLITSRLVAEENRRGAVSLAGFYIRRAFRILPAATVFLTVAGLLSVMGVIQITLGRWLSVLFFMANYSSAEHSWYVGHFWSLAVEEHFYFVWPAVFILVRDSRRRMTFVLVTAFALAVWRAVDFKFQITGSTPAVFWGRTDIQADSILWGVFIALLYADRTWRARLEGMLSRRAAVVVLLLCLVAVQQVPTVDWKLAFMLITVKAILIPLALLATIIHSKGLAGRVLETGPFRFVGRLSYSLYLWQQLFLAWNEYSVPGLGPVQQFPLNFVCVFACASLSLFLIETPLIAMGHRISRKVVDGSRRKAHEAGA
jgi:peptidoglycan/LPS O-acetylase OafA/YrhL